MFSYCSPTPIPVVGGCKSRRTWTGTNTDFLQDAQRLIAIRALTHLMIPYRSPTPIPVVEGCKSRRAWTETNTDFLQDACRAIARLPNYSLEVLLLLARDFKPGASGHASLDYGNADVISSRVRADGHGKCGRDFTPGASGRASLDYGEGRETILLVC
jgi:hypothetical protein